MAHTTPDSATVSASIDAAQATTPAAAHLNGSAAGELDEKFRGLNALLADVEPSAAAGTETTSPASPTDRAASQPSGKTSQTILENRLVHARLGLASSLLMALRCRDANTAAHCVRVALGCSAWSLALQLPEEERDALEIAALLHDVGKIGVPDSVLLKPGPLTVEEQAVMDTHRTLAVQILESSCAPPEVLSIVRYCSAWYDGTRRRIDRHGADLPLGSRILAIVNAFDSMTSPQVYHAAMSHDRAIQELCEWAGTQFDPKLVVNFAELHARDQQKLQTLVARRWLQELDSQANQNWWWQQPLVSSTAWVPESLHQQKLLENMYDGVIFVGPHAQIMHWNRGAQRLTGINGSSVLQRLFTPSLIYMRDQHGRLLSDTNCPVAHAMHTGVQSRRRLLICSRSGGNIAVDMHVIPVVGTDGAPQGATVLLHDVSDEASLEERCHHLYEQAIRDPLTQLANRAEFDRAHALFLEAHRQRRLPCSLIICDLDHFKAVNDTFGHLAGDEAIKSFSQLLKSDCHPGDLVARFGGEEFVILCADSNNAAATERAEHLRRAFHELPQPMVGGKNLSASFGVTELQPGDTVQTMLNRADRALLMAKQAGRNLVVQLGSGGRDEPVERRSWWRLWQSKTGGPLLERRLVTNVPIYITAEKLLGFVADQRGMITSVEGERVEIHIQSGKFGLARRRSDRSLSLTVELRFYSEDHGTNCHNRLHLAGTDSPRLSQTEIQVVIRSKRGRERRQYVTIEQARHVMASLQAYLMANDAAKTPEAQTDEAQSAKTPIMMSVWLSV